MQRNGYGPQGPPPQYHPPDHVTPFLVDLNRAVAKLSHAVGEIKGTVRLIETEVREVRNVQGRIKERVRRIETAVHTKPSALDRIEKIMPILKEAWPFIVFAIAAITKGLGYDLGDLSGIAGP